MSTRTPTTNMHSHGFPRRDARCVVCVLCGLLQGEGCGGGAIHALTAIPGRDFLWGEVKGEGVRNFTWCGGSPRSNQT